MLVTPEPVSPVRLALPSHHIIAPNLAAGWEQAVLWTWENGAEIETQYDNDDSPPSRDAAMKITVQNAFAEPRLHRAFPGGMLDLEVYRQEVVYGIHDHWINPEAGMWEYTYHVRLAEYRVPGIEQPIDQIRAMAEALIEAPHTRRAQAVTWQVWNDLGIDDPACLQRIWCRIFGDELVMAIHIRSNDAFKAAFMNMFAFSDLQRHVAELVSEGLGREIRPGQYEHVADSFHIYGNDFSDFEGFLKSVKDRKWENRTWHSSEMEDQFVDARAAIVRSIEIENRTGQKAVYN